MSDLGFSLLQNGSMGFSSATDFDKAKNYTDKEITIKSISANGSAIVPDENKNVDITIPAIVDVVQTTGQSEISVMSQKATTDEIELLNDDLVQTENIIGIENKFNIIPVDLTIVDGFYSKNSNTGIAELKGGSPWHTAVIDVSAGERYVVKLRVNNSQTYGIIFTDDSMLVIDRLLNGGASSVDYTDYEVIIPYNATKMILCSYYTNTQIFSCGRNETYKDYSRIEKRLYTVDNTVTMNYIYVSTDGSDIDGDGSIENPYATIYHANEMITDNDKYNRYTIIVGQGTYTDLQTKYEGTYHSSYEGVVCKDYVFYESENILRPDLCVIEWDGTTGFETPVTQDKIFQKCPFHINPNSQHTHIKGFKFVCANLRYALHIEMAGVTGEVEWLIEHCIFNWGGRPLQTGYTAAPIIGCGTSFMEKGTIRNCQFNFTEVGDTANKNYMVIQTHDNNLNLNPSTALKIGEDLTIENCSVTSLYDGFTHAGFNLRINKNEYDVPPRIRLSNIVGFPCRFILLKNSIDQVYKVIKDDSVVDGGTVIQ